MKILVSYTDFHADNYQGGSGNSFEFKTLLEVHESVKPSELKNFIHESVWSLAKRNRPFTEAHSDNRIGIQKMELFL